MNKHNIIVDSCLDYDEDLFKVNGTFIRVPFGVNIDDTNIIDKSLDTDDLLLKMRSAKKILSSAPSPYDYIDAFSDTKVNFVITISSKLSGSYNAAIVARDTYLEDNKNAIIYVIDSKSAASGENLLAYKLKLLLDEGIEANKVYEEICKIRDEMETYFILQDYSVFIKNGRISNFKSLLIDLLHITPIMCGDNGSIAVYKKFRGVKKAYNHLIELFNDRFINKGKNVLMITYCAALEKAKKIKEELNKIVPNLKVMLLKAGGLSTMYANDGGIVFAI